MAGILCAQDTRQVTEPKFPPVSIVLRAQAATADTDKLDTRRIQQAMDRCKPGRAVELSADADKHAFVSGPLSLRSGVTLLIDKGVMLFASDDPRVYDKSPGVCGTLTESGHGCKALINGDGVEHAAVMGEGVIDGRGGAPIRGQNLSWWDLAEKARNTKLNQNCPRILELTHCNDFTLYRVTLRNSPNFHVMYSQGDGFTAWGVKVFSPKSARNTDGIDPSSSRNVTITHCYLHTGDDQVAIKAGSSGSASHMTIAHNHFYTGHGMSIGSETNGGVNAIRVSDLTIDGSDNGIRIKSNASRGGLVEDVEYENVCIRNTKVPILMDTHYSFYGKDRDKLPTFRNIVLRDVDIRGGGKITFDGFDAEHRLQMKLSGVVALDGQYDVKAQHADFSIGPGMVNLPIKGPDVHGMGILVGDPKSQGCQIPFEPFPADAQ